MRCWICIKGRGWNRCWWGVEFVSKVAGEFAVDEVLNLYKRTRLKSLLMKYWICIKGRGWNRCWWGVEFVSKVAVEFAVDEVLNLYQRTRLKSLLMRYWICIKGRGWNRYWWGTEVVSPIPELKSSVSLPATLCICNFASLTISLLVWHSQNYSAIVCWCAFINKKILNQYRSVSTLRLLVAVILFDVHILHPCFQ